MMPFRICLRRLIVFILMVWISGMVGAARATQVIFKTSLGNFRASLFDAAAPITVKNFLKYVDEADYDQTIIHRSVKDFVIQSGGFKIDFSPIPADPPIINESSLPNIRGTLSMATRSGDPNSATSQWFINLVNNSPLLDLQNGGFTVFGEIVPTDMSVVDAIAALPKIDARSIHPALSELPLLVPFVPGQGPNDLKLVVVNSIDRVPEPHGLLLMFAAMPASACLRAARWKVCASS
ncbi:MAG: peptidylprolyl isomerase [Pirellulales bacterium]